MIVKKNYWNRNNSNRQKELLEKTGLPIKWPKLDSEKVLRTLQGDKKVKDGKIRFIIPKQIGKVEIIDDISKENILPRVSNSITISY